MNFKFLLKPAFITFCLLYCFSTPVMAKRAILDDHVRYPVLVTLDNGTSSSGFYFNNDTGDAFFVTARHIFFTEDKEKAGFNLKGNKALLVSYTRETELNHPLYVELDLQKLFSGGHVKIHPTKDVTVVKIGAVENTSEGERSLRFMDGVTQKVEPGVSGEGTLLGANPAVMKMYDDVLIGNDVFIFGYPISLGIENYPQIDFKRPLLRKGIIAGKNDEKKTIILDCPTVYGNSGGPVIEVEQTSLTETRFWIIGLVSEFIPFQDKWYNLKKPFGAKDIENSGYSVVIPIDTVLELVDLEILPQTQT